MKALHSISKIMAWSAGILFVFSLLVMGCRPPFPQCRDDDDCKAEEGNSTLLVCVNGQCQECGQDSDCPKERPRCKENRCVECVCPEGEASCESADCPEDKKYCENNQCTYECEIDGDCDKRGKPGMICKDHKCQWECETDADCGDEKMECKDHHCVPRCLCQKNEDCPEGKVCKDCECVESTCDFQPIHFDFNRYELRGGDQEILDKHAECLKQKADISITIEGHCDERGTEEYNIALGDKRARAAQKYLKNLGIDAKRVKTISYGEGRPVCNEATEDCWGQNRRDEFVQQ